MRSAFAVLFLGCFAFLSCSKDVEPTQPAPEPTPTTLKDGLLLYLPFDGNLADSSGGGNNGTAFGSVTYGMNRYFENGKSVSFNGVNSRIEIPGAKFDTLSNFTIYLEFMPLSASSMTLLSRAVFAPALNNPRQSFNLMINHGGGGTRFSMKKPGNCDNTNTSTAFGNDVLGQGFPSINGWNYVAITYNGTTIRSYLNGNLIATDNQPGANLCSNAPLLIGSWWQGDPYYFNGRIDEVRVYNRPLSTSEITSLFQLHK